MISFGMIFPLTSDGFAVAPTKSEYTLPVFTGREHGCPTRVSFWTPVFTGRVHCMLYWWRGPAVEHWSLADVLSLSCVRLVADG